jgi:hypothetical protein
VQRHGRSFASRVTGGVKIAGKASFPGQVATSSVAPRPLLNSREGFDRYCLEGWVSSRKARVSKKMVSE